MNYPKEYRYTKDHEWAKLEGKILTVGITHHAQSSLGDIVHIELPKVGRTLKSHETFGVVESIKAVSDLYAPVAGIVKELNDMVTSEPALLNSEPHDQGWMMKMEISNPADYNALMDASAYEKYVATL